MKCLVLTLPLLVLASACGGGGENKADDGAKAAYLTQAEAICTQAIGERKLLKTPQAASDLAPYVAGLLAVADSASAKINALTPPAADRAELAKQVLDPLAAKLTEGHAYADKVAAASAKNDEAALTQLTLNPPKGVSAQSVTWMKQYGFKDCVEVLQSN